jgi:hypothetical protein
MSVAIAGHFDYALGDGTIYIGYVFTTSSPRHHP